MSVDGIIYSSVEMMDDVTMGDAPEQVANVAALPGVLGASMAMPDIHWGYGFPIGGVAAVSADDGVVSPGGVGFDVNCGVRLVRTDLDAEEIRPHVRSLVDAMFKNVPSGLGSKGKVHLSRREVEEVSLAGARWAVERGYGWKGDLERLEERGAMTGADPAVVSDRAFSRGMSQVGSLGAGNHFLEVQRVDEIYDADAARAYGIDRPGQVMVMIHTGSRGFGHQICTDSLQEMEGKYRREGVTFYSQEFGVRILDRQLAAAPASSRTGERYLGGMCAAANFAWANRQMIAHWIRESFSSVLARSPEEMGMATVYDVAHNIAKLEEHEVDGKRVRAWVHRKGATRAFGPGRPEVVAAYRDFGQPVLIPGDMGSASYVLRGTDLAMRETFGSTCHGAGRVLSRTEAVRRFRSERITSELMDRGIYVRAASPQVVAEEAPGAYKDVSAVVDAADGAGISKRVARLVPMGVVKG
ncbi:MAG: RtcB family protein [Thermoplasmata archaeon]|nr:RtcB family protein [Thermoplasmata archaeon]